MNAVGLLTEIEQIEERLRESFKIPDLVWLIKMPNNILFYREKIYPCTILNTKSGVNEIII
ncbi:hypothetical protein SAMN03080598_02007 [Algoriphagus boritolerans DSM 17298 = JCM 18970]|uniref:Uncharacterized protein n=1 Tax=Algoriphagus boritolerans DSM 17298 = JCM 18970 TaxID=1120964 RepID=A0A1H5WB87_9BACT|nr:hypothetical protein SAMN03080598_02007 [Algoriphagus boritolerans DSM 17298 = JCM 18970]